MRQFAFNGLCLCVDSEAGENMGLKETWMCFND